eukprot:6340016-Ditylum_brightwellii.AAC.1
MMVRTGNLIRHQQGLKVDDGVRKDWISAMSCWKEKSLKGKNKKKSRIIHWSGQTVWTSLDYGITQ